MVLDKTENPNLNQREKDVLKHVSEGQSYKQVAVSMDLSERTIKFYMGQAKNKLKAKTVGHATALFVRFF